MYYTNKLPLGFDTSHPGAQPYAAQRALLAAVLRRGRAWVQRNAHNLPSPLGPMRAQVGRYAMRVSCMGQTLGYSYTWAAAYNIASQYRYVP